MLASGDVGQLTGQCSGASSGASAGFSVGFSAFGGSCTDSEDMPFCTPLIVESGKSWNDEVAEEGEIDQQPRICWWRPGTQSRPAAQPAGRDQYL